MCFPMPQRFFYDVSPGWAAFAFPDVDGVAAAEMTHGSPTGGCEGRKGPRHVRSMGATVWG